MSCACLFDVVMANSGQCERAEVVAGWLKMAGITGASRSHWSGRKGKECYFCTVSALTLNAFVV